MLATVGGPKFFLELTGRPFSNRCSALGVRASFLTECLSRPMKPLLELELDDPTVGENEAGVEGIDGDALRDFEDDVGNVDGLCLGD